MTQFRLMGATVILSTVLAGPTMARHVTAYPGHYARSADCAAVESKKHCSRMDTYDARQGWRTGGGWDSRDYNGPAPLLPFGE